MSQTESVENPNEKKKKHRWYHWFFLVLFVVCSAFNLCQGIIFSGAYVSMIASNIAAFISGSGDYEAIPESLEFIGDDVVYVNSENEYKMRRTPTNSYRVNVPALFEMSIEGDSEGAWLENDWPRAIMLYAGEEGTVTISAWYTDFPKVKATKTVQVVKAPITEIDVKLSTDTELTCGTTSHLLVNNDDYSTDLSRINFCSSNTDVASIDDEGYIKTLSEGTTEVYAVSAEDESVVSDPIEITVTDGSIEKPSSISVEPIKMYAKLLQKVDAVFNNGNECDDCVYEITSDEDVVRQGEYLYSDIATDPINIRVSSVYDPSVYCDTTVEFVEVKCTGLELVSPKEGSIHRELRYKLKVNVLSEVEGVDVTYDELLYEVIDGEDVAHFSNNVIVPNPIEDSFTVRVSLIHDPSIYFEATYNVVLPVTDDDGQTLVDKIVGHYLLFAINGALGALVIYYFFIDEKKKKKSVVALVIYLAVGIVLSIFGELVQSWFSATRNASLSDIGINIGGYMTGFAVVWLILFIMYLIKKHKKKNAKNTLTKKL